MMTFIWVALLLVILSIVGLLVRIFLGPSIPDRLVALDAIGVILISSTALLSVLFGTKFFMEVILLIAIMSFIGTVAFSKFVDKVDVIARDHNSTLTGVFLYFWLIEGDFNIKLLLGIVFLFGTAPIAGHIMARAAYISGVKPSELTVKDELEEVVEQGKKEASQTGEK